MVDPISLMLTERIADHAVEFTRRGEIASKGFFDDHACPTSFASLVQIDGFEMLQDGFELVGPDRKIKEPVAACAAFLVDLVQAFCQALETGFVAEVALMIKNRLAEVFPDFVAHVLARKFPGRFLHFAAKVVVTFFATGETDHSDSRRQLAVGGEIVKRRQELPMSQIASSAKDDHAARLRDGASG